MARLGTHARPAVIRVQNEERAQELLDLCTARDWQVIVGVEPDEPEDITDVQKLLTPELFTVRRDVRVGRNDPCPCGSGQKFKKCCLPARATTP
jgi:SWIM/SEC-C metal-binding protein